MARKEFKVTLPDASGEEHVYELTQHTAEDGADLLFCLVEILGESAGDVAGALGLEKGTSLSSLLSEDTGSPDASRLGAALTLLGRRIIAAGGSKLCKRCLTHTRRQNGDRSWSRVGDDFSTIYQGNYAEMLAATVWAIKCNFESVVNIRPFALAFQGGAK